MTSPMHGYDENLASQVFEYLDYRIKKEIPALDGHEVSNEAKFELSQLVQDHPTDPTSVLNFYKQHIARSVISADSPKFLSFIPTAPSKASLLFDMLISSACLQGMSWLEASGVVAAENHVLRILADAAGMPSSAGGTFVPGGTSANLWALVVARDAADQTRERGAGRDLVAVSSESHSSLLQSIRIIGAEPLLVPTRDGRLHGEEVREALASVPDHDRVIAVTATAGTTNAGFVDYLASIGEVAKEAGAWFHVDAAYGGGGLFSQSVHHLFDGISEADSLIIDPHKWMFSPYDCSALLYREPDKARTAFTQKAVYFDVIHADEDGWNPSDYAHHSTRRARGLPLWFSMAVNGLNAYRHAVETTLAMTRDAARLVQKAPHLELVTDPELSVLLFHRTDWTEHEYGQWWRTLLAQGKGFVVPTRFKGKTVARMVFVNPETTLGIVQEIFDTMISE